MTPASPLDLVAVIPVYNEEANLASVTQEWLEALAALGLRHKILLIDDGSKDRTPEIAADLAARHPGRVAHVRKTNSGHGRSCRHGYDLAEFGLDAGAIAERFAGYVERYDIPLERAR